MSRELYEIALDQLELNRRQVEQTQSLWMEERVLKAICTMQDLPLHNSRWR